ncbi:MAG: RNA pseudouridine synthase [Pseudomonadota bacterium]
MRNRPVIKLSVDEVARIKSWVVHQDRYLVVFNKPSGIAVQTRGNRGTSLDHLLWAFARSNGKRPHLINRIDTGTSGLVLAGLTKPATAFFNMAFADRKVRKTYLAVVAGRFQHGDVGEAGACDIPLRAVGRRSEPCAIDAPGAQAAETAWRVLAHSDRASLIEAKPQTGRLHQIRVHMAALGHPILGDPIYGDGRSAARLMLHAAKLKLPHPGGASLALQVSSPDDFMSIQGEFGLS